MRGVVLHLAVLIDSLGVHEEGTVPLVDPVGN